MTINKAKEGITQGEDMGKRAVMKGGKPVREATKPESRPKSPKQKDDEMANPWKGGIDKFAEGA